MFQPILSALRPSLSAKALACSALVASLSVSPLSPLATPARADGKDVVAGMIIGGIIGSAIATEEAQKKKKKKAGSKGSSKSKSTKAKAPSISPEQKAANIEVQEALNHFGWPVGTADGAIGPKSRAAIKEYQAFLGFPATGELTDHERTVLVTAYHRAKAGGSAIAEIVSGSVHGMRGVLIAQAAEMAAAPGGTMAAKDTAAPQPGSVAAAAAAAIPALLPKPAEPPAVGAPAAPILAAPKAAVDPAPQPPVTEVAESALPEAPAAVEPEPEPEAPEVAVVAPVPESPPAEPPAPAEAAEAKEPDPSGPGLPTFLDANGGKGTLLAACNAAAMQTAANGGPATLATLTDAGQALTEQFCLARGEAIATAETLMQGISGHTPAEIAAQCLGFAPMLADHVAALSLQPQGEVLAGVDAFILQSGMSPAQLSGTAKVCLGVGYAEERQDVAIGSALLLVALGEGGYAELPGHHLARGFGAAERPDLAEAWYDLAANAIGQGNAAFAPEAQGRDALIVAAARALSGSAPLAAPVTAEPALPTFATATDAAPDIPVSTPAAEGPGAEAFRMGAGLARLAVEAPLLLLGAAAP